MLYIINYIPYYYTNRFCSMLYYARFYSLLYYMLYYCTVLCYAILCCTIYYLLHNICYMLHTMCYISLSNPRTQNTNAPCRTQPRSATSKRRGKKKGRPPEPQRNAASNASTTETHGPGHVRTCSSKRNAFSKRIPYLPLFPPSLRSPSLSLSLPLPPAR